MRIGFIGLGHMGLPMALNLVHASHEVYGLDVNETALAEFSHKGGHAGKSIEDIAKSVDVMFTMLPEGHHVRSVYEGDDGIFAHAPTSLKIADCSTIDMDTTLSLPQEANRRGLVFIDAPVSGGVKGAAEGTLTFMVGGDSCHYETFVPFLNVMGKRVVHCGGPGAGQAAKICNNMVLAVSMIATSEAFLLAEKLGLSAEKFFEVASGSSAQNWSLTSYCPVPGLVPSSPANRNYEPGFTAAMMLKDLRLADEASKHAHQKTPLGNHAMKIYEEFCQNDSREKDFSSIIKWLSI